MRVYGPGGTSRSVLFHRGKGNLKVRQALTGWAGDANWDELAEAKKPLEQPFTYKIRCRIGDKTYKAELLEDGTFKKKDAIPAKIDAQ